MSSLLSGIVFVPKSKRKETVNESESTVVSNDRKRQKRNNITEGTSRRDRGPQKLDSSSANEASSIYEDTDVDEADFTLSELAYPTEPEFSDRMSWMLDSKGCPIGKDEKPIGSSATEQTVCNSKEVGNFQSLLKQIANTGSGEELGSNNAALDHEKIARISLPEKSSNKCMADVIRERLKNSKGVLKGSSSTIKDQQTQGIMLYGDSRQIGLEVLKSRAPAQSAELKANIAKQTMKADSAKGSRKGKVKNGGSLFNAADFDINSLLTHEKLGGDDMDSIYRENILRLGDRYKGKELGMNGAFGKSDKSGADEEGDVDMTMFQRLDDRLTDTALRQRQIQRAISEKKRHQRVIETCCYCVDSSASKPFAHLIVCTGEHTMLRLKPHPKGLVRFHCEIVPITHANSILDCEEEIGLEIDRFKSCLSRMFEREGQTVLFLESAVRFNASPHASIDVVPVSAEIRDDARVAFREALASCDEEWSQHKKVINLTKDRPLCRAIPQKFQYLAVDWVDDNPRNPITGAAHAVENEDAVNRDFCLDVVAGLLDVDPQRMRGKRTSYNSPEVLDREKKDRDEFVRLWEPFDWTKYV